SIINDNRNPGKSQEEIEEIISKYLGVKHFIWLTGMRGDDPELGPKDTDCHIDGSVRFANESTVLCNWTDDETTPEFRRVLKVHYEELKEATTESGKPLTVVPVPNTRYPVHATSHIGTGGKTVGKIVGGEVNFIESFGLLTTGLYVPFAMVLPYIISFYLVLGLLEDVGYLPRLAVLMDTIMHRLGLHGYAIIPTLLGLGCNVPAILATRILESKRERFIAATLISIAIPCAALQAMIFG
ncbi:unnamed protein product, partial [marine sediment metagenome]